jgi:hypothetical protein
MEEDADRFRRRARECRDLAEQANGPEWRETLLQIAKDLEHEADQLDAQGSEGSESGA